MWSRRYGFLWTTQSIGQRHAPSHIALFMWKSISKWITTERELNQICGVRKEKVGGASSFPFQRRLALNVFLKLLIKSAFYDVIGTARRPGLSSPEVKDMKVDRVTYHRGRHNFTQLHQTMLRDKRSCSRMHCICHPGLLPSCCSCVPTERKNAHFVTLKMEEGNFTQRTLMWAQINLEKGWSFMFWTQQCNIKPSLTL